MILSMHLALRRNLALALFEIKATRAFFVFSRFLSTSERETVISSPLMPVQY